MPEILSNLYVPLTERKHIVAAINEAHLAVGYQAYNPFPGGTGTPAGTSQFIRLFAARPQDGYVRIMGHADALVILEVSAKLKTPILELQMLDSQVAVCVIRGDLTQFLHPGKSILDVSQAMQQIKSAPIENSNTPLQGDI